MWIAAFGAQVITMTRHFNSTTHTVIALAVLGLGLTSWAGCGNSDDDPIVGSGVVDERVETVAIVEQLRLEIGLDVVVMEGEPEQIIIRGEDNLIDHIVFEETAVGAYDLSIPAGLSFEQHDDIEIEVPFIDMVNFTAIGENVDIQRANP